VDMLEEEEELKMEEGEVGVATLLTEVEAEATGVVVAVGGEASADTPTFTCEPNFYCPTLTSSFSSFVKQKQKTENSKNTKNGPDFLYFPLSSTVETLI